jgi:hypothetical protein
MYCKKRVESFVLQSKKGLKALYVRYFRKRVESFVLYLVDHCTADTAVMTIQFFIGLHSTKSELHEDDLCAHFPNGLKFSVCMKSIY